MKIGIDASRAFIKNRTGIEEYSYQVIKNLMNKLEEHQVILYIRRSQKSKVESQKLPESWRIKVIKWPYLWTQVGLSLELFFHTVDVLFIPAHTVPCIHPKNTIVTIHGLEYEFCPKAYSFWARLYMRWSIKNSCKWAKTIIAVSNNTKNDLVKLYNVPEEKINVVYEGTNLIKNLKIKNQNDNSKFKIDKYLLFIGRLEKRKNILGIIEAFEILKEKYKIPHKLVLAGEPGYGYQNAKTKMQKSKYRNEIIFNGFIGDEEKYNLLKNADVFLFPSFYEGFGLPILEAQSAGVPVVTSNISSIPEITGAKLLELKELSSCSAILINPNKPDEIAKAAYKFISDENLRNDIINKGFENVKRFSWEKCANEISKLILC
ncbi:MAG: glycosyltransferase family 1 protein [Patescibacteria group bacterium]